MKPQNLSSPLLEFAPKCYEPKIRISTNMEAELLPGFDFVAFYVNLIEKALNSSFWNILAEGALIISDVNK